MIKNTLTKKIEKIQSRDDRKSRDYIGASLIGSECLRQIWYEAKGFIATEVPSKIKRTWEIGKVLEGTILNWLTQAGVEISMPQDDFEAQGFPYFKGHVDSVWIKKGKAFAIIEVKTAKDSSYMQFFKKGLKEWNPQYYAQVQSYMGMSGIHRAYILVLNKDNSDISDELVVFDELFYINLTYKAQMIFHESSEPTRISNSPMWFKCKMCKFHKICHNY